MIAIEGTSGTLSTYETLRWKSAARKKGIQPTVLYPIF